MNRKLTVITCPDCGKEYLPAEIFIPKSFFGCPELIRRDTEGKIKDFLGSDMDLNESYCCDNCGKTFSVTATVLFETKLDTKMDFSSDYITKITPRFELAED